jgi:5-methyltetrahydropteroyltriglutamate--homocysteine methyltransferase
LSLISFYCQTKPSFITYPIAGLSSLKPGGVVIPFEDGHSRQLPVISEGPFEYTHYAVEYLRAAREAAGDGVRMKQAVIAASALSLLYPSDAPIDNYSKDQFIDDVVRCAVKDISMCLEAGAECVQVDFTEGRLALKLDPSGAFLQSLLDINERVFSRFSKDQLNRIGVHVCPGADNDSCHSADVPYHALLGPLLSSLSCGRFYLQMKSEANPDEALQTVQKHLKPHQVVFVGVTDVNTPRIESADEVCDCIVHAAQFIPLNQLGVCDDCGFSPFADDVSTSRQIAFSKIQSRVQGTALAREKLMAAAL